MAIGLDVGSTTAKLVRVENGKIKSYRIVKSQLWQTLLEDISTDERAFIYSTGYFRHQVPHRIALTEITAATYGVKYYYPDAEVIIDIGGQDTKVIDLRTNRFLLNDKCSSGTGAFLEFVANYFNIPFDKLGAIHFQSSQRVEINNTCGVFALSEMISALVSGYKMADVIAGMHYAFARRISYLVPVSDNIVLIGGAVKNRGIVAALSEIIGTQVEVRVPEEPQIINALGASLYGAEL